MNGINTKLLLAITLILAGIGGALAYHNRLATQEAAQQAAIQAEHRRFVEQAKQYQKAQNLNWGGSAKTLRDYRSK